ncbi:hypothetical protein [Dyella sp. ASV21]|uniref:hypothetical protein n=1 Tax=Dyella sp. ASV21 TaxID=2795114 RepID=UPI0018EAD682|nr:hypothetical protein [Dyella sp. ASV21]
MALKYDRLDAELFTWLRQNRRGVTTAKAINALGVKCTTAKRHVSRRFSQLEDRGVLVCDIQGTTRVCQVVTDPPATLAKQRVTTASAEPVNQNIPASNADEFVALGGRIERIPAAWENPSLVARKGSLPIGLGTQALPYYRVDAFE